MLSIAPISSYVYPSKSRNKRILFWRGGKELTNWSITCFDSKLLSGAWLLFSSNESKWFCCLFLRLNWFNIALCAHVKSQDFTFSFSTLSLFNHNFSKVSCTMSLASSESFRKWTAKRYKESLCWSMEKLYSALVKVVVLQLKQMELVKSYRSLKKNSN